MGAIHWGRHSWQITIAGRLRNIKGGNQLIQHILMKTDRREEKVGQLPPSPTEPVSETPEGPTCQRRGASSLTLISPRTSLFHRVPRLSLKRRSSQICHFSAVTQTQKLPFFFLFFFACLVPCWAVTETRRRKVGEVVPRSHLCGHRAHYPRVSASFRGRSRVAQRFSAPETTAPRYRQIYSLIPHKIKYLGGLLPEWLKVPLRYHMLACLYFTLFL